MNEVENRQARWIRRIIGRSEVIRKVIDAAQLFRLCEQYRLSRKTKDALVWWFLE